MDASAVVAAGVPAGTNPITNENDATATMMQLLCNGFMGELFGITRTGSISEMAISSPGVNEVRPPLCIDDSVTLN
jgi:hypothetical protein